MHTKILVVLIALTVMGVSPAAIAKGGGGGGGGKGGSGGHVGHAQFGHPAFHPRFDRQFLRNQFLLGGIGGWGWDGGWPYGEGGYSNTNVVVYPQAIPQFASGSATPCHWNEETFKVPSVSGGTEPVSVVSCR
jgi:hypothetical protein